MPASFFVFLTLITPTFFPNAFISAVWMNRMYATTGDDGLCSAAPAWLGALSCQKIIPELVPMYYYTKIVGEMQNITTGHCNGDTWWVGQYLQWPGAQSCVSQCQALITSTPLIWLDTFKCQSHKSWQKNTTYTNRQPLHERKWKNDEKGKRTSCGYGI